MDDRLLVLLALLVFAPLPMVVLVALLRGYDVHLSFQRRRDRLQ